MVIQEKNCFFGINTFYFVIIVCMKHFESIDIYSIKYHRGPSKRDFILNQEINASVNEKVITKHMFEDSTKSVGHMAPWRSMS